jgi:hypothetical protein
MTDPEAFSRETRRIAVAALLAVWVLVVALVKSCWGS